MHSFTVDPPNTTQRSPFVTLRGTKTVDTTAVFVNATSGTSRYPTNTSWEADILLTKGVNTITVYAEDTNSNRTNDTVLSIDAGSSEERTRTMFNTFDEWGLLLNLRRLPGEKNLYYRNRLIHTEEKLGGTSYAFLIEAVRRELSLLGKEDVLTVRVVEEIGQPLAVGVNLTIETTRLTVEANVLRKDSEAIVVDSGSGEFVLSEELSEFEELSLVTRSGQEIPSSTFEVLSDRRTVRIFSPHKYLYATYKYVAVLPWSSYFDLASLVVGLNALSCPKGRKFITASTTNGTVACSLLKRTGRETISSEEDTTFDYCEARLIEMWDQGYQDSLLNVNGTHFGTKLEVIAKQLRQKSNLFVLGTVLDRDRVVRTLDAKRTFSVLPHLADADPSYYSCTKASDTNRYNQYDYLAYNGACPNHSSESLVLQGHHGRVFVAGVGSSLCGVDVVER